MGECMQDKDLEEGMIWGDTLLEFSLPFDIVIANAYFKKTEDHLVMYKSGINKSQLNFLCL